MAIVDLAAKRLETFVGFRIEWVGIGQHAHLFLQNTEDKRRSLRHLAGQVHGEVFQLGSWNDVIDQPAIREANDGDGLRREEHFFQQVYAADLDEIQRPVNVVGDAELGWSDGKGGILCGDNHVAAQHQLTCAAPYRALDHGNHGVRTMFDLAHHLAQRIVVGERISTVGGQFPNIVACGKHLRALGSA